MSNTTPRADARTLHTPGPWTFERNGKSDSGREPKGVPYFWINLDAPGHLGGMRCSGHASQTDEESVANARLIAAAPDLLAAAKDAQSAIDGAAQAIADASEWSEDSVGDDTYAQNLTRLAMSIRAAIAKAEGS